jgi:hypothetical protein
MGCAVRSCAPHPTAITRGFRHDVVNGYLSSLQGYNPSKAEFRILVLSPEGTAQPSPGVTLGERSTNDRALKGRQIFNP